MGKSELKETTKMNIGTLNIRTIEFSSIEQKQRAARVLIEMGMNGLGGQNGYNLTFACEEMAKQAQDLLRNKYESDGDELGDR